MTALIGSTVNFTWSFSNSSKGSGRVIGVGWGLSNSGASSIARNGFLVFLEYSGRLVSPTVPVNYNGRVDGSLVGNKFSGQAIFSLTSIKKSDQRLFGCKIFSESDFDSSRFDTVNLLVVGG